MILLPKGSQCRSQFFVFDRHPSPFGLGLGLYGCKLGSGGGAERVAKLALDMITK